jgi:hypothetical protein
MGSLDDIFGTASTPAATKTASKPLPAVKSSPLDDIFGMPAPKPSAESPGISQYSSPLGPQRAPVQAISRYPSPIGPMNKPAPQPAPAPVSLLTAKTIPQPGSGQSISQLNPKDVRQPNWLDNLGNNKTFNQVADISTKGLETALKPIQFITKTAYDLVNASPKVLQAGIVTALTPAEKKNFSAEYAKAKNLKDVTAELGNNLEQAIPGYQDQLKKIYETESNPNATLKDKAINIVRELAIGLPEGLGEAVTQVLSGAAIEGATGAFSKAATAIKYKTEPVAVIYPHNALGEPTIEPRVIGPNDSLAKGLTPLKDQAQVYAHPNGDLVQAVPTKEGAIILNKVTKRFGGAIDEAAPRVNANIEDFKQQLPGGQDQIAQPPAVVQPSGPLDNIFSENQPSANTPTGLSIPKATPSIPSVQPQTPIIPSTVIPAPQAAPEAPVTPLNPKKPTVKDPITLQTDLSTPENIAIAEHQSNILTEMDLAEAGKRIRTENNSTPGDATYQAQPSTFPEWIPSELRRKTLLDAVREHILSGTIPKKAAEVRLYDVVKTEMDSIKTAAKEVTTDLNLNELPNFLTGELSMKAENLIKQYETELKSTEISRPSQQDQNIEEAANQNPQAEHDWETNFAEPYLELAHQEHHLASQIKQGGKAEAIQLQPQLDAVVGQMGAMEETFIKKWAKSEQPTQTGLLGEKRLVTTPEQGGLNLKPQKDALSKPFRPQASQEALVKAEAAKRTPTKQTSIPGATKLQMQVIPGASEFFQQDVLPAVKSAMDAVPVTVDDMKKLLIPASRGPLAKLGSSIMREKLGEMARNRELAFRSLEDAKHEFDKASNEDNLAFIEAVENGTSTDPVAKLMRDLLADRWAQVQKFSGSEAYIENYFPHIWKDPAKAAETLGKYFGKRPLQGSKSYLKERKIPTIAEGVALGLEPVSYNPVDSVLARVNDMDRYITAQKIWKTFKEQKLIKFVQPGGEKPAGWVVPNDRIAQVFYRPTVTEYYDEALMAALNDIADSFGIKHERSLGSEGLGSKDLGASLTGGNLVKTKFASPEDNLLHEIGHQIDDKYGMQLEFLKDPMIQKELNALADLRFENKDVTPEFKKYVRTNEEKMAVMFQAYLHAPERFQQVAPQTYEMFKDFLGSNRRLKAIRDLRLKKSLVYATNKATMNVLAIGGSWYMPEQLATVMNNYLSPGLAGKPIYDGLRMAGNFMNSIQLGISGFHAGFTTMDAIISKTALGIMQISQGKPLTGLKNVVLSPIEMFGNFMRGNKLLKAYYSENGEFNEMVQAIVSAGGRVKMDSVYHNSAAGNFMKALKSGNYPGAALRATGAIIEKLASPILEELVPRQKLGVFSDLAQNILDQAHKGEWSKELVRERLQEAWDSVDNRLGQLVYDNLFWNKMLKDIAMVSQRSVGWNLGTIRELGGAATDVVKLPFKAAKGEGIRMTPRMSYAVALPVLAAIAGAIYMYLKTGERPKTLEDYFFPKSGDTNPDGSDSRVSLPTYMKDVYAYGKDPIGTLKHKLNPLLSSISEMLSNQDYFGTEIRNANDPVVKQIIDEGKFWIKQFKPFTATSAEKIAAQGGGTVEQAQNFFGITPAPSSITRSAIQNQIQQIYSLRFGGGVKTQAEAQQQQDKSAVRQLIRTGQKEEAKKQLSGLVKSKELTVNQANALVKTVGTPTDVYLFGRLSAYDQRPLIEKMTLDELKRYAKGINKELKMTLSSISPVAKQFVEGVKNGSIKLP